MPVALSVPMLLALASGYLLGSIPFGLALTLLDALKGTVAVHVAALIGAYFAWSELQQLAASHNASANAVGPIGSLNPLLFAMAGGFGAFLGHLYPVWLGFKGGKGVATYIGVLFGLAWPAGVAFCAIWLLVAVVTRYSSLSALLASVATPLVIWLMGLPQIAVLLAPLSALLIYKHRSNIQRLLSGQEPRIGADKIGAQNPGTKA